MPREEYNEPVQEYTLGEENLEAFRARDIDDLPDIVPKDMETKKPDKELTKKEQLRDLHRNHRDRRARTRARLKLKVDEKKEEDCFKPKKEY